MNAKELFEKFGVSQTLLANALGTTRQNVSLWFTGGRAITLSSMRKIVSALDSIGVKTTVIELSGAFNETQKERENAQKTNAS